MLNHNLFEKALIEPFANGADEINIVSGYASSSMAIRHLEEIIKINPNIKIKLVIGMSIKDGITIANHKGFLSIQTSKYSKNFECNYVCDSTPVHSKVFIYKKNDLFFQAFIGSANYSQTAFSKKQRELMQISDDPELLGYFDEIEKDSISILHQEIDNYVKILSTQNYLRNLVPEIIESKSTQHKYENFESHTISLLSTKADEVQSIGGLNWGQRPKRNRNQAYIQLPPNIYKSEFFPKKPNHFLVETDDNKILLCVRAQKKAELGGTAIETPLDNSLIGEYFRNRMNLPSGVPIWKKDLEEYGRTNVTFYKIDEETFFMDFSI